MDNAGIHKAKKLKTFLSYLTVHYIAPYSLFNNPIEEVFGLVKFHYRKLLCKNN